MHEDIEMNLKTMLGVEVIPKHVEDMYDRAQLLYSRLGGGPLSPQTLVVIALVAELQSIPQARAFVPAPEATVPEDTQDALDNEPSLNELSTWAQVEAGSRVVVDTGEEPFQASFLRVGNEPGKLRIRTLDSPPKYKDVPEECVSLVVG